MTKPRKRKPIRTDEVVVISATMQAIYDILPREFGVNPGWRGVRLVTHEEYVYTQKAGDAFVVIGPDYWRVDRMIRHALARDMRRISHDQFRRFIKDDGSLAFLKREKPAA